MLSTIGILHGNKLELEEGLGYPDGIRVRVTVEEIPINISEKRAISKQLTGAWSEDESLVDIFDAIARDRHEFIPRKITV